VRVIARGQHVVRIDKESIGHTTRHIEEAIYAFVNANIDRWDGIVISDYAKGFITKPLTQKIIGLANTKNTFVIGDTKPVHAPYFKNVFLLAPNLKEAKEIAGVDDVNKAGKNIQRQFHCNVLITEGSKGMTLFEAKKVHHFPTKAKEVFDVAGAGDTVVAVIALSLASGSNLEQATVIANHAAGIVVGKIGTATVSTEELKSDLLQNG
jgi:D-beta-D-heptose 7-phosphate kinase/D-beta-D-heptose 1-phosphate adenosyltransferase